ncbi:MAG: hypothetical protein IJU50_07285 [Lachnospiraceae bacterium]|nr:hypothetical protein [Lachnospiraceae bacterium]
MELKYQEASQEVITAAQKIYRPEELKANPQLAENVRTSRLEKADEYISGIVQKMYDGDQAFEEEKSRLKAKMESGLYTVDSFEGQKLKDNIGNAFGAVFKNAKLSSFDMSKRKKEAEEKRQNHQAAQEFQERYTAKRNDSLKDYILDKYKTKVSEEVINDSAQYLNELTEENPLFSVMSDWAVYTQSITDAKEKKEADRRTASIVKYANQDQAHEALKEMEKHILLQDFSVFDYKNDQEFLAKLEKNYPKIRALRDAVPLYERTLRKNGFYDSPRHEEFKARLETIEAIWQDYDSKVRTMSSPYYVLLKKKDLEGLSLKELEKKQNDPEIYGRHGTENRELRDYMRDLVEMKKKPSAFKQGESAAALLEKKRKPLLKEEYERTKKNTSRMLEIAGYKDARSAVNDKKAFQESFYEHWLAYIKGKYNPADYPGSFAKMKANLLKQEQEVRERQSFLLEMDEETVQRKDQEFGDYYLLSLAGNELQDLLGGIYHPEESSPYSLKERGEYKQLKSLIDNVNYYISDKENAFSARYDDAMNPQAAAMRKQAREEAFGHK